MKKTISILLAVVMLLGCIGVAAVSAAETTVPSDVLITNAGKTYTAEKGSSFTYTVYVTTPETVENGQFYITYPEDLFEVKKCSMPNTPGAMFNYDENLKDEIRLNFSNTNGCDLTTEKILIEVQCEVIGEGNGSIVFYPQVMCNLKDVSIVNQAIFRETIVGADIYTPTEVPSTPDSSDSTEPSTPSDSQDDTTPSEPAVSEPTVTDPTSPPSIGIGDVHIPNAPIYSIGDEDLKGSTFNLLQVKNTSTTKKSIKITYKKPSGTKKFVIYGSKCGKNYKMLKKTTAKSFSYKNLKKNTYYKIIVVALNSKGRVVATSKTIHVATKGGKYGNPSKVKITNAAKVKKITKGTKIKIKTKVINPKNVTVKTHRSVQFESTKPSIVKVASNGQITAKKRGTATVYAYAQNGVMSKVKVTVK